MGGCTAPSPRDRTAPAEADRGLEAPSPPTTQAARPRGKRVDYAPGLVIDFARGRVEVKARVVLRRGLLELLACSPRTKEHESILIALARPLHIYQALGLIGLTPGHPAAWDPKQKRRIPPTGGKLTISIAYERDGRRLEVDAWDWMQSVHTQEPVRSRPWIFTGSIQTRDGGLAADYDGNVISLVDFGTELIGLAEMFSADNDQLWLQAYTDRIPPPATPCTLILRPASEAAQSLPGCW